MLRIIYIIINASFFDFYKRNPPESITFSNRVKLTIDDSRTIRKIIGRALKNFACKIVEAANGIEGLAVAAREKPDIIILDITMPGMDGYETLKKLKGDAEMKTIPVVMLSAEGSRDMVTKIAKLGVHDYIVKPFSQEAIVESLSSVIDLKPKGPPVEESEIIA